MFSFHKIQVFWLLNFLENRQPRIFSDCLMSCISFAKFNILCWSPLLSLFLYCYALHPHWWNFHYDLSFHLYLNYFCLQIRLQLYLSPFHLNRRMYLLLLPFLWNCFCRSYEVPLIPLLCSLRHCIQTSYPLPGFPDKLCYQHCCTLCLNLYLFDTDIIRTSIKSRGKTPPFIIFLLIILSLYFFYSNQLSHISWLFFLYFLLPITIFLLIHL